MTVQFILPEAISFPKERKLHDRLFLVLLYNLLCKTFKDHSSTFAASSRTGAHPSFARALLPDCECKGRAFLHSLQDFDEKKCVKNSFVTVLLLHSVAKSVIKSVFSLHPLPIIFAPKPPFFARFGHFWVKIHLFRGVFLFSSREILARKLILHRQKQFDGEFFGQSTRNSTLAGVEKEKVGVFSSNHRRSNIKTRKVLSKYKHKDEKTQAHHGKGKGQNQKANILHGKDQAQASKRNCFSLPPPLHSKNTSRLSLKLLHFSRLPPLFLSKPPYPAQNPFHPTRRKRAYAYIHACALSEFAIFAFTLHLTPQQTVDQPVEGEGKPCIHLHLHRNKLNFNTLHDIRCKKQMKAKGRSLHP